MGVTRKPIVLQAENVWKEYRPGTAAPLSVLRGVDLDVRKGEMVVIVGPSGSGKSTLLHILGGLDRPSQGTVRVADEEIVAMDDERLAKFRNRSLGFVFQFHHLLPEFTALENICMPAMIAGRSLRDARPRAEILLQEVGLLERMHHKPSELSGGEQQRVAVARALMNEPPFVLADEPSGNLDEENGHHLHRLMSRLSEELGVSFVIATHNPDLTKRATRVMRLQDGRLVATRHPERGL
jgi:lipoprotein-releasing system ATP-binding protein